MSQGLGDHSPKGMYLPGWKESDVEADPRTRLDPTGVIQVKRRLRWVYNPVTISQYGLQQHAYYLQTGDNSHLVKARTQAGWIVNNQDGETGKWFYDFRFRVGGLGVSLEKPWASAMAQGQAMSLLVRMQQFTSDTRYRDAATAGMAPLEVPVSAGGLQARFFGFDFYFEEYPTTPPSYTLNGFAYTIVGLYDLWRTLSDADSQAAERAHRLYARGRETFIYSLPFHEAVSTSAYHLGHITNPPRAMHTSERYHRLHVRLLRHLHKIDPHQTLHFYAERWALYM